MSRSAAEPLGIRGMGPTPEVRAAAHELMMITICRCGPEWTGYGKHAPECLSHLRGEVRTLARAAGAKVAPW